MTSTITIDGHTVELHDDGHGLVGYADRDGTRFVVHATVTPTGRTITPAKYCASRGVRQS